MINLLGGMPLGYWLSSIRLRSRAKRSSWDSLTVVDASGQTLYTDKFDTMAALDAFDLPTATVPLVAATARPAGSTEVTSIIDLTELARDNGVWVRRWLPGRWAPGPLWTVHTPVPPGTKEKSCSTRRRRQVCGGTLDLGTVNDVAEIAINGSVIGSRLWTPYWADVTAALRPGGNLIRVRVTNTGANARGQALTSGLIGPVFLRPERLADVTLTPIRG